MADFCKNSSSQKSDKLTVEYDELLYPGADIDEYQDSTEENVEEQVEEENPTTDSLGERG